MKDIDIQILSDRFGQYEITLHCECGHTRRCLPKTLANMSSWDARLDDFVRRMRCSKCGQKKCTARTVWMTKPPGYRSNR